MAGGLALTGIIAFVVAQLSVASYSPLTLTEFGFAVFASPLHWVIIFAPLALVFLFSFRIHSMKASTAQVVFWAFAALMGLSLSTVFVIYTGASVAKVFFITAGTFAGMSLYGYTTKRDLTAIGSFLMMGLIGLIIAMVVNIFLGSSALDFAISVIGVLIFIGLTAYDTQKIKESYIESDAADVATKKAISGALNLYLDFINLFVMLLRLFGATRE
jgi:uncharacterized protein